MARDGHVTYEFFFSFFNFFFSTSILSGGNGVLEDGMVGLAASPGPCPAAHTSTPITKRAGHGYRCQ